MPQTCRARCTKGRCTLPGSLRSALRAAITSQGSRAQTPPSPRFSLAPFLRICVSVLDTLMHSDQLAGAHHPSLLEKLAFKLRYFREVNHPGEASAVCSLFLWKEARSFGLELLSLQGGVGSPWAAQSHLKGWHQTLKRQCRHLPWFKPCPIPRPQLNTSLSAT